MSPTASTTLIIDIDSPALPHWLVDWARSAVNTPTPTFSTITLNATPASGYSLASKLTGWLLTLLDNAIFQRNPFKDFALVSRTFLSTTRRHQLGVAPDSAGNLLRIRLSPEPLCREPLCREPLCPKPLRPQALTEATPACPIHIYIQSPILDAQSFYQARLAGISAFSVIFNAAVAGKAIHTSTAQLSAQGPQSIWASYRLFHRRLERLFSRAVQAALANTGSRALLDAAPLPTPLPLPTQALLIPIRIGKENEPDRLRPRDSTLLYSERLKSTMATLSFPMRIGMTTGLHYYYNQVKGRLREGAESWHVILAQRNSIEGNAADDLLGRPTRFTLLPNPPGHFLADPFVVNANGQEYLFVEDYDYSLGRGIISCACLPSDEAWSTLDFKPVLRCDWHLSYPYVFEHEGCFYMVPEAAESGGVDLYQADEFPWRWRHVKRLIEGANIVDATLILHNNLWWLFAAIGEANTSTWDELFLYYAPSPLGPWQPHPQCPLKTDISSARPAGRPFWHDGRLLRPAQDCTLGYGSGLTLCEVVELTPTGYRERPYRHSALVNAGHIGGTHTFNASLRHVASDIRIKTKLTKPAHVDLQWVDIKNTTPSLPKKTMNKHPHHPPPAIRSI